MKQYSYEVTEDTPATRVDQYIASRAKLSRARVKELLESGNIELNGSVMSKIRQVKPGDKIVINITEALEQMPMPNVDIIYEDQDVLVINKPSGLLSQPKPSQLELPSAAQLCNTYFDGQGMQGLVHRLDRGTSGVMIMAKSAPAAETLKLQFAQRSAKKQYIAIIDKPLAEDKIMVDAPIARSTSNPHKFRVHSSGKPAQTLFKPDPDAKDGINRIIAQPITGRTHQIRVHLSYIGRYIAGDQLYSSVQASRMMLHARQLDIRLPNGESKQFIAQLPQDFEDPHA